MKSPRRQKVRPSLKEFTGNSSLRLTDEEWRKLSAHCIWKRGEEGAAKRKIDNLLLAFEIAEVERLKVPLYKKKLQTMAKVIQKLDRELLEMQVIVLQRVVKSEGKTRIIKHANQAMPSQVSLQKIRQTIELFQAEVATAISQLSHSHFGPDTSLIHLLVGRLNEIVVKHSAAGPLKQSYKRNGVEFVAAVLKIASERSKSPIDKSMATQAIKVLKKNKGRNLDPRQKMGITVDTAVLSLNTIRLISRIVI